MVLTPGSIKKIILCVDNSELSGAASQAVLNLAPLFQAQVIGVHGYNASMHEAGFQVMEPSFPAAYQREDFLKRQRKYHETLIRVGLEKISLSYLKPLEEVFHSAGIPFQPRVQEGKNFKVLDQMIREEDGDLVVMGASGFSHAGEGFIGSVCLRVLRSHNRHFLLLKKPFPAGRRLKLVAALDGSASALRALRLARFLAGHFQSEIHLLYVFDSSLHKDIFRRLKESLLAREGFSFNSREQEKIHDEFIDRGLARVGWMILEKAQREVFEASAVPEASGCCSPAGRNGPSAAPGLTPPLTKKVLDGPIHREICTYAAEIQADLVLVGRTGRHFTEGMDLGSVAENVIRFAPCSVLLAKGEEGNGWEL